MDEGDDSHLCSAFGALEWIDLIHALYARDPTTFTELLPIVALLFFRWSRGELSLLTSASA